MRGVFRRRRRRQQRWRLLRFAMGLLSVTGVLFALFIRCRPVLTAFAESQAVWLATKTANRVVAQVLTEQEDVCHTMIETHYNEQQVLSSVITDATAINTVRTAVTAAVMRELEQYSSISVGIPLGTLAGFDWLSGWGPLVTFPMSMTATVLSNVSSSLEAVGMNQSTYRVLVHINITLYVVTPGGRSSVGAEHSYPMAEAVLLGEVPDTLTEVYGDDQTLLGKIFDYGTVE